MFRKSVPKVVDVRELISSVAGPRSWSDTRKSWLARAARRAGISYRQCKSLFYAEITDHNHRSARLMRDAAEKLAGRYESIARGLHEVDSDFHGADRDSLLDLARALRRLGISRDEEI